MTACVCWPETDAAVGIPASVWRDMRAQAARECRAHGVVCEVGPHNREGIPATTAMVLDASKGTMLPVCAEHARSLKALGWQEATRIDEPPALGGAGALMGDKSAIEWTWDEFPA